MPLPTPAAGPQGQVIGSAIPSSSLVQLKMVDLVEKVAVNNSRENFGTLTILDFSVLIPYLTKSLALVTRLSFKSPRSPELEILHTAVGVSPSMNEMEGVPWLSERDVPQELQVRRYYRSGVPTSANLANVEINFRGVLDDSGGEDGRKDVHIKCRIAVLLNSSSSDTVNLKPDIELETTSGRWRSIPRRRRATTTISIDHEKFGQSLENNRREDIRHELLLWAAALGDTTIMEIYLDALKAMGARDLDFADQYGNTPLIWAARNGRLEVVEILLERGAKPFGTEEAAGDVKTPLTWAAEMGRKEVVRRLLQPAPALTAGAGGVPGDGEIAFALSLAAPGGHREVLDALIEARLARRPDPSRKWVTKGLRDAVQRDQIHLVRAFADSGARIDDVQNGMTPLCTAAQRGKPEIVDCLLVHGANPGFCSSTNQNETPLFLAVRAGKDEAVRVLIEFGADVEGRGRSTNESLLDIAVGLNPGHPMMVSLISAKDKSSALVETVDTLHEEIDCKFHAKAIYFTRTAGSGSHNLSATLKDIDIHSLLKVPSSAHAPTLDTDDNAFTWFHLPANNMRWVEVLISQLCKDRPSTYRILKDDRWLGRQHHGKDDVPHARFMQPLCQGFTRASNPGSAASPTSPTREKRTHDKDIVLFMPYLHWEDDGHVADTKRVLLARNIQGEGWNWKDDPRLKLIQVYGIKDDCDCPFHPLHIRRTLDQFYYHTLDCTDERDQKQTVSRYHDRNPRQTKVVAMVDQLWLWVLVGPSGRADTVITCFPSTDQSQFSPEFRHDSLEGRRGDLGNSGTAGPSQSAWPPRSPASSQPPPAQSGPSGFNSAPSSKSEPADQKGLTDVLANVLRYIQNEPQAVKTAYDLAGVIASRCSRTFLNPSSASRIVQFAEIYEGAISDIMDRETKRFEIFSELIESRKKKPVGDGHASDPVKDILELLDKLKPRTHSSSLSMDDSDTIRTSSEKYHKDTLTQEIPTAEEITKLVKSTSKEPLRSGDAVAKQVLQKLGNFYVLDITEEIKMLREIKDIQDELNIMTMVFEDQTQVLGTMERIIRSTEQASKTLAHSTSLTGLTQAGLRSRLQPTQTPAASPPTALSNERSVITVDGIEAQPDRPVPGSSNEENPQAVEINLDNNLQESDGISPEAERPDDEGDRGAVSSHNSKTNIEVTGDHALIIGGDFYNTNHQHSAGSQAGSEVWGTSYDPDRSSLPVRTVQLSVDDIARMSQRAEKANRALDFLVDLKQKQSNVMDSRSARIQAEQSLRMTIEAETQSKTLMIFTVVTIVFLPLSFMTSFFALNITEFRRDDGGTLGLSYVSEILFPISVAISAVFIYVAFEAQTLEHVGNWVKKTLRIGNDGDQANNSPA